MRRSSRSSRRDDESSARKTPPSLARLAKQRKFDDILHVLLCQPRDKHEEVVGAGVDVNALRAWLEDAAAATNDKGVEAKMLTTSSALHVLVMHCPPPALVTTLIHQMKALQKNGYVPEAVVDERGQTPLHIAVRYGCSMEVIQTLTSFSELPVTSMDNDGRFPLHWACAQHRRNCQDKAVQIVHHLIQIFPQAAIVPDQKGHTPLYLAKSHRLDSRIIDALAMVRNLLNAKKQSCLATVSGMTASASDSAATNVPAAIFVSSPGTADDNDDDDLSSVGSRGISRDRRAQCERLVEI